MRIQVRVHPRAGRDALKAGQTGTWKLYLTAPPVEGKANEACIEFFARGLRIPRARVRILSGQQSRQKLIELDGIELDEFAKWADESGAS